MKGHEKREAEKLGRGCAAGVYLPEGHFFLNLNLNLNLFFCVICVICGFYFSYVSGRGRGLMRNYHENGTIFFNNLVNQTMLDINSPGIGAGKVPYQFFKGRWFLKGFSLRMFNNSSALEPRPAAASFFASRWAFLV